MEPETRVLRLFRAVAARPAFDADLRDTLVPAMRACPGMLAVWIGRRGEDDLGERATASLWASEVAMRDALGDDLDVPRLHPELWAGTTDRRLEVHPTLVHLAVDGAPDPRILRIARGRVARIDLATYAQHVADGARRDVDRGRGPSTLVLTAAGTDRFLTLSLWADWESIAVATGASRESPVRTREQHELIDFTADHFELVTPPS